MYQSCRFLGMCSMFVPFRKTGDKGGHTRATALVPVYLFDVLKDQLQFRPGHRLFLTGVHLYETLLFTLVDP